jgi:membrane protease YdiL (CAAX protease family)
MAVLISSSLFSLVHAQQYGWRWQNLVLLLYVGIVLGTVRARTGSIVPSTLLHAGYNAALSTALLAAGDELYKV